jgi:glucose/arabinose dehydrogenase
MHKLVALLLALCAFTVPAAAQDTIAGPRPQAMDDRFVMTPPGIRVETWASGLVAPWSLAFLPDGQALVSERNGNILLVERDGRLVELGEINILEDDESGLMGIAVHPDFPNPAYVYAMYTWYARGNTGNAIARFRLDGYRLADGVNLIENIPAGDNHNGGRIGFGPDGMLYVGTGDIFQRRLAQRMDSLAGKILRFRPDGGIPADNPFPGSPIWSLGHRNIQGLAWDPRTGAFYNTEHGPSGEVDFGAYDEINLVEKGGNFGWPLMVGAPGRPGFFDPIAAWPERATPPSGAAFWRGDLFVATLGSEALLRLRLENERVVAIERWFNDGDDSSLGRLRDAVRGPDGALYVLTGNKAWRGDQRAGDDRILRITVID